jgi:MoxR-like ATPase
LIRLSLGYPSLDEEAKMLSRLQRGHPIDDVQPVVSRREWIACQEAVRDVHVDDKVKRYLLEIIHSTRMHDDIQLGG